MERTKGLDLIHPRSLARLSHDLQRLVRGRLWLQVLVAMALGIATLTQVVALQAGEVAGAAPFLTLPIGG